MRSLIVAAILAAGPAMAVPVARSGGDTVRLLDKPCAQKVLPRINPEAQKHFRLALATVDGKSWSACWTLRPDGLVILIYEDGDGGLIPVHEFKDEPGV